MTVRARLAAHRGFGVALLLAAALRLITMLGYRPAMWFSDSYPYVSAAIGWYPDRVRPGGYSFLLAALSPSHSFAVVTAVQHLMGLAIGIMGYALLRSRFRLPGWGATLAMLPVLFDAYQIQLEHLVLSDTLFAFLVTGAVTVAVWRPGGSALHAGLVAGGLLGLATLTRTIGLAILVVFAAVLLRKHEWRVAVLVVATALLPVVGYATWFHSWYGRYALTSSDGVYLWARTASFADCAKIDPPAHQRWLCRTGPRGLPASAYVWRPHSPLKQRSGNPFTPANNAAAADFARRAIVTQPYDYAAAVADDLWRSFRLDRPVYPDAWTYSWYEFSAAAERSHRPAEPAAASVVEHYERGPADTRVVEPYAGVMRHYQDFVRLPGAALGVLLLVGLVGLLIPRLRRDGQALLPWATAVALVVLPPVVVDFDYRYLVPAVPLACVAAAIAVTNAVRYRSQYGSGSTGRTPARSLAGSPGA